MSPSSRDTSLFTPCHLHYNTPEFSFCHLLNPSVLQKNRILCSCCLIFTLSCIFIWVVDRSFSPLINCDFIVYTMACSKQSLPLGLYWLFHKFAFSDFSELSLFSQYRVEKARSLGFTEVPIDNSVVDPSNTLQSWILLASCWQNKLYLNWHWAALCLTSVNSNHELLVVFSSCFAFCFCSTLQV